LDEVMRYGVLIGSAFLAGAINTLAGGGTLLTFPALLRFGQVSTGVLANGTSTVALVPGSISGAWGLRRELGEARRWLLVLLPPCVAGGALGTLLVTQLPPEYFDALVPWLILSASLLFIAQPLLVKRFGPRPDSHPSPFIRAVIVGFQFLVAIYGGYFGAGIGILMLSSLGFLGITDVRQLNALKTILAAAINLVAVVVFVYSGDVIWKWAWPMALGAIGGGYAGALLGRKLPRPVVRWFVIVVGLGLSAYEFARRCSG
jgi:uncharacterized protein